MSATLTTGGFVSTVTPNSSYWFDSPATLTAVGANSNANVDFLIPNNVVVSNQWPILAAVVTTSTLQGQQANGLTAGLGIASVTINGANVRVNVINNTGGSLNVTTAMRFLFLQMVGL